MAPSNIEQQFKEFIASHPTGTYEEWIGSLHPESKEKCLLEGLGGELLIDQEFYAEDNEHRLIWNSHLDNKRTEVPSSPAGSESGDHDSAMIADLLGDGDAMVSPLSSPRREVSPDEDLLSFD